MKWRFRLILVFFIFLSGSSIAGNLDSLLNELSKAKEKEIAPLCNQIAREYLLREPPKSLDYIDKAIKASSKYRQKKEESTAYFYKGFFYKKTGKFSQARYFLFKVTKLFSVTKDTILVSKAYNALAQVEQAMSHYDKAINYLKKTIDLKNKIGDKRGQAIAYLTLGNIYNTKGEYQKSIFHYQNTLKIARKIDNKKLIASALNSIGIIYENLANYKNLNNLNEALKYYRQAEEVSRSMNDTIGIIEDLSNIGNIYAQMHDLYLQKVQDTNLTARQIEKINYQLDSTKLQAITHYEEALKISQKINNIKGIITLETNLAGLYNASQDYEDAKKALKHLAVANSYLEEVESAYLSGIVFYYQAQANLVLKRYNKAKQEAQKALELAKNNDIKKTEYETYRILATIYDSLHDYRHSLEAFQRHTELKEQVLNEETNKLVQELNKRYQTKEKERLLQLRNSQIKRQEAENKQQRLFIFAMGIVVVFVIVFIGLIFRQYRQKKKANEELAAKNHLITEQKQEITDSIQYAQYIQLAVFPPNDYIHKALPESSILFKPRDIVSGDFYWVKEIGDMVYATAADCTGHGVPGAFMSLLGTSFLNEIMLQNKQYTTGEILDLLRKKIITSLHQTGESGKSKDGMDISFVGINKATKEIQFSGAQNPLYIIRSNEEEPIESDKKVVGEKVTLYEIKGDKMPIGISGMLTPFKTNIIKYKKGDRLFMFSDGFADQFGGPKGKKLKYLPFKNTLLNYTHLPIDEQLKRLEIIFEAWKKGFDLKDIESSNTPVTTYEQTDDVIVFGIEL